MANNKTPLQALFEKGDLPGVIQADVINQAHPGYMQAAPDPNVIAPAGTNIFGQPTAPLTQEDLMNMVMGSSSGLIGSVANKTPAMSGYIAKAIKKLHREIADWTNKSGQYKYYRNVPREIQGKKDALSVLIRNHLKRKDIGPPGYKATAIGRPKVSAKDLKSGKYYEDAEGRALYDAYTKRLKNTELPSQYDWDLLQTETAAPIQGKLYRKHIIKLMNDLIENQ